MQRREFVTSATATIAAASLAGCSGVLGGDGGSSGPESGIQAYADAINDDDAEALEAAIHPESPDAGQAPSDSELESLSMSIQSTEVTEGPENGVAVVETVFEATLEFMGEEQTETQTVSLEVRKHEGNWKYYQEA